VKIRRPVAVKMLRREYTSTPQLRGRFEREARVASRLDHPGCVAVTDFGACGWELFLVMELLEGRSLADALDAGPVAPADALGIAVQILDALEHAHGKGVVHRDLKPGNVFLCTPAGGGTPQVKLCDFGFAKIFAADAGVDPIVTESGTVFGTPAYMSPEQATASVLGPASDQYSAAAVIFETFGGSAPFPGADAKELMLKHVIAPAPDVRERNLALSGALAAVLQRALAKRPHERYADVSAFRDALLDTPEGRAALRADDTLLDTVIELSPSAVGAAAARASAGPAPAPAPARAPRTARARTGAVGALSDTSTRLALEQAGAAVGRRRGTRARTLGLAAMAAAVVLLGAVAVGWQGGASSAAGAAAAGAAAARAARPAPAAPAGAATPAEPGAPAATAATPPRDAPSAAHARALWLAGDADAAMAEAVHVTNAVPGGDPDAELIIGHVYFDEGEHRLALGRYRRALDRDPTLASDARLRANAAADPALRAALAERNP